MFHSYVGLKIRRIWSASSFLRFDQWQKEIQKFLSDDFKARVHPSTQIWLPFGTGVLPDNFSTSTQVYGVSDEGGGDHTPHGTEERHGAPAADGRHRAPGTGLEGGRCLHQFLVETNLPTPICQGQTVNLLEGFHEIHDPAIGVSPWLRKQSDCLWYL